MSHKQAALMSYGEILLQVGARIAKTRGELTQAEFAALLGVDRKTVFRWEAGERMPDGDSLLALFMRFQADPGWVLTGAGSPPPLSAREASLIDNYRHASEAGRKALEQTGTALAQSPPVKKSA